MRRLSRSVTCQRFVAAAGSTRRCFLRARHRRRVAIGSGQVHLQTSRSTRNSTLERSQSRSALAGTSAKATLSNSCAAASANAAADRRAQSMLPLAVSMLWSRRTSRGSRRSRGSLGRVRQHPLTDDAPISVRHSTLAAASHRIQPSPVSGLVSCPYRPRSGRLINPRRAPD